MSLSSETLFRIATQYGTGVQAIANANTLSNIALISMSANG
ncbi:MAG: LysM peptidoglycan-binding domain-containing protein [Anaerolineae bacterium]